MNIGKQEINVREYRRGNKIDLPEKLATQGTQDEEKQNKNTTQHNMCRTHLYVNKHKQRTQDMSLIQTTGGKDETNKHKQRK